MAGMPPASTGPGGGAGPSTQQSTNRGHDSHGGQSQIQPDTRASGDAAPAPDGKKKRKKRNKKKQRKQSFAATSTHADTRTENGSDQELLGIASSSTVRPGMYGLGSGRNLSNTSLESEALLDHRDQQSMRPRRSSIMTPGSFGQRASQGGRMGSASQHDGAQSYRPSYTNPFVDSENSQHHTHRRSRVNKAHASSGSEDDEPADDRTPLMGSSMKNAYKSGDSRGQGKSSRRSLSSAATSRSSRRRRPLIPTQPSFQSQLDYDVNNPPSMPGTPRLGADMSVEDVMVGDFSTSIDGRRMPVLGGHDSVINIDDEPQNPSMEQRRRTIAMGAEEDVCFPLEGMSEIAEDDMHPDRQGEDYQSTRRHRRARRWPDLSVLDDWSQEEKKQRSEEVRTKKMSEPILVGGRLRPNHKAVWHRTEEDAPYRFTYFNEEFQSTVHSQTISELQQSGHSFREFFVPDFPELSDSSSSSDDDGATSRAPSQAELKIDQLLSNGSSRVSTLQSALREGPKSDNRGSSGDATPSSAPKERAKKYGARPTFWLDVLSPTDTEMKVLSKAFGIHPLTAEDIMMQEAREKVELFRNYYFVNYRTFEQDMNNEDFLEPVEMYVVVFREGVISFHFSQTPHPANVRRRIRQLKDYLILSSDWISYAIIDDITDVFAPLIQSIEDEVDDIDDAILQLHSPQDTKTNSEKAKSNNEKRSEAGGDGTTVEKGADMLRRVGDCRKKVMGLYRLLGNKADVIKGFAKRCNEQWEVAPRSEIGLYLGDIQDHIVTMTSNLSHYEKILARSHGNYLAQINIRMNERQEQTADVLGRLTVLGTIVLPMNIITGLWGMNCLVPGQDGDNLTWFWGLTAGLLCFGFSCYFIAKRVYSII